MADDTEEKVNDLLARAVGYMSRVVTATKEDQERLAFAQDQVLAALAELRKPPPRRDPTYGWRTDERA